MASLFCRCSLLQKALSCRRPRFRSLGGYSTHVFSTCEQSNIASRPDAPEFTALASKKVVQTELGEREYELLSTAAKNEKLSIKEAARRALLEWSTSGLDAKQDPLFRLKPVRFREKIRSSEIDRALYRAK